MFDKDKLTISQTNILNSNTFFHLIVAKVGHNVRWTDDLKKRGYVPVELVLPFGGTTLGGSICRNDGQTSALQLIGVQMYRIAQPDTYKRLLTANQSNSAR